MTRTRPLSRPLRGRVRLMVAGLAAAMAVAIGAIVVAAPARETPPAVPPSGSGVDPRPVLTELGSLQVGPRPGRDPTYRRDAFGTPWADVDGNGCNQRDDVLLRDAVPGSTRVQTQGGCDHDVLAGTWVDPYTGARLQFDDLKDLSQAQAVQIDHVVPLAEAWASGAAGWDDARRSAYANDLAGLLAVDGPTNAAKGADDPAAWRPRQAEQCDYAVRWVATKHRWDLAVDTSEVRALREMLATCSMPGSATGSRRSTRTMAR